MFGILRPELRRLNGASRDAYLYAYCNLCGHLRLKYGLKSRMLVVHDIATLAWLLLSPAEQAFPLLRANCVRGMGGQSSTAPPLWNFMASISACAIGIKLRDDAADEGRLRSRWARHCYRDVFIQAETDLSASGFPLEILQAELQNQNDVELRRDPSLRAAAAATGVCYELVATEIARHSSSPLSSSDARIVGNNLGKIVYAIDALRDFTADGSGAYNPLRVDVGQSVRSIPYRIQQDCRRFIVSCLETVREVFRQREIERQQRWDLLARRIVQLAGFPQRNVVLYGVCCFPCGDAAVACDTDECGQTFCACCVCVACGAMLNCW